MGNRLKQLFCKHEYEFKEWYPLVKIIASVATPIIAIGWLIKIFEFFWPQNKLYPILALMFLAIVCWLTWLEIRLRRVEDD